MKLDISNQDKLIEKLEKHNEERAHEALAPLFVSLTKAADQVDSVDSEEVDEFIRLVNVAVNLFKTGRVALRDGRPIAELESGPSRSALPAGTDDSSSDELKALADRLGEDKVTLQKWMVNLFGPLAELSEGQLKGRSAAMQMVASGTLAVKDDGTPVIFDDKQELAKQFAPFQTAAASLKGLGESDQRRLIKGMNKVADETTKVDSEGIPTTVKDLADARRQLANAGSDTSGLPAELKEGLDKLSKESDTEKKARLIGAKLVLTGATKVDPFGKPIVPSTEDKTAMLKSIKSCVEPKHLVGNLGPTRLAMDFDKLYDTNKMAYDYIVGADNS